MQAWLRFLSPISVYRKTDCMNDYIIVDYEGDNSIKEIDKRAYSKYINEYLSDLKSEFKANKGCIKVKCKSGNMTNICVVSNNESFNKMALLKLSSCRPFQN